jgi:hypothetical protein
MKKDPAGLEGRHLWGGVALALIAILAITALAAASTVKRFDSKVTLSASDPFHGRVTSDKHACEVQRKVKVFNVRPGPDGLFGTDSTNNHGRWSIPATPNGDFYARVKRREEGTAGTIFVCRPDRSKTRHFG